MEGNEPIEDSMSLTKTRHSVRTFALFVCWLWSSFLGCAAKRSSSFLHPSLHIVLTCSSPCLLGFPPQTLKSCVPSPLFYLAQKLSSALGLAFSMCTGAEQQKELDGKGIHKGIHVTVFTRQWFLNRPCKGVQGSLLGGEQGWGRAFQVWRQCWERECWASGSRRW